jgi:hypothetical protein
MKTVMRVTARTWAKAGVMLLLLGLCSCVELTPASAEEPDTKVWKPGGAQFVRLDREDRSYGSESSYNDYLGRPLRIEKRNFKSQFLPGACICTRSYTTNGQVELEQFFDANEKLCLNEDGYALRRCRYTPGSGTDTVIEESFLGLRQEPVLTRQGFARLRRNEELNGRVTRLQFYDVAGKPASAVWLDVTNVAEVKFVKLQGVTEVTGAILLDGAGNVVGRKQVDGLTADSWATWNHRWALSGPVP